MMNEAEKAKRVMIIGIKHKLQFGGLNAYEQNLAKGLMKMGLIGRRHVSPQYAHLIPVAA